MFVSCSSRRFVSSFQVCLYNEMYCGGTDMKEIGDRFSNIIAWWLPGALLLWMLSYQLPPNTLTDDKSIGGFLFASLAALVLGVIVNALRWSIFDRWFFRSFDKPSHEQYSLLKDSDRTLAAFQALVDANYRWYQAYANAAVAVASGCLINVFTRKWPWWTIFFAVGLLVILVPAARNELDTFYQRAKFILK